MKQAFLFAVILLSILVVLIQQGVFEDGVAISNITPEQASAGSTITIEGQGFGTDKERVIVYFNELGVKPETVTDSAVVVKVPQSAASGLVSVLAGDVTSEGRFFKIANQMKGRLPPGHVPVADMKEGAQMPPKKMGVMQQAPPDAEGTMKNPHAGPTGSGGLGHPPKEGGSAHEFYSGDEMKDAIDFALPNEKGEMVKLSDFKGKVVALNFWATWCEPCLMEVPSLERLTKRAEMMDLVVLAVSVDKSFEEIKAKLPDSKLNILLDKDSEIATKYGTVKFPETWIIDREGKVIARFIGARNWDSGPFAAFFKMVQKGEAIPMGMGH